MLNLIGKSLGHSTKDPHYRPSLRKFFLSEEGGEKKLFLIIVDVLGHPKGRRGLTSYFHCGSGMVVFWKYSLQRVLSI
jgi:hypothetical protein